MLLMDGAHYDFEKAVELLVKAAAGGQADAIDTLAIIKSADKRG